MTALTTLSQINSCFFTKNKFDKQPITCNTGGLHVPARIRLPARILFLLLLLLLLLLCIIIAINDITIIISI